MLGVRDRAVMVVAVAFGTTVFQKSIAVVVRSGTVRVVLTTVLAIVVMIVVLPSSPLLALIVVQATSREVIYGGSTMMVW